MLLPSPRHLKRTAESFRAGDTLPCFVAAQEPQRGWLERRAAAISAALGGAFARAESAEAAVLRVGLDPGLGPQAYRLKVAATGIDIRAGDAAGAAYGLATLAQWLREASPCPDSNSESDRHVVPGVVIRDAPDFPVRGVVLDVSRNKVPTLDTLCRLIDLFASWKINHLELYTEHTFAYRGHERVWKGWSPLTPEDVRELDVYCRERFVELVPNQNSFGHLHRWLVHEPYRQLAECPDGFEHPFSHAIEPFSLCPTDPRCLDLLADLYDQLLPCFGSRLFHVGLDETVDLGRCRSAEACAERGTGRVYLDFLRSVHGLVVTRGRRMAFWADMMLEHPELVAELPRDAIATVWGYEADHPFGEQAAPFVAAGLETWVCPGTSSWCSLGGRVHNALENIARAALEGRAAGARGLLVTDWGDYGHLQPLPVSYPGWLAAASFAWNTATARSVEDFDLAAAIAQHAGLGAGGEEVARALLELGDVYRRPGPLAKNGSVLFHLLLRAGETLERPVFRGLDAPGLEAARVALDSVEATLSLPSGASKEALLSAAELRYAAGILRIAVDLGLGRVALGLDRHARELPEDLRASLRQRERELDREFVRLWRLRYRPGGLAESQRFFERLHAALVGGSDIPRAAAQAHR
ncbi:MAG TPA: family 20 glycosylhydrolase [Thermoanaerobaculia bacterium]|nr:family 20 glycosylhydrolase [Thermoanaerobaculia bacterium]